MLSLLLSLVFRSTCSEEILLLLYWAWLEGVAISIGLSVVFLLVFCSLANLFRDLFLVTCYFLNSLYNFKKGKTLHGREYAYALCYWLVKDNSNCCLFFVLIITPRWIFHIINCFNYLVLDKVSIWYFPPSFLGFSQFGINSWCSISNRCCKVCTCWFDEGP